jgi:Bacterial TniB protein
VHHLQAGSRREQPRALDLLKFVANELKIAVIVVGTHDAFHAMQSDSQVASRPKSPWMIKRPPYPLLWRR